MALAAAGARQARAGAAPDEVALGERAGAWPLLVVVVDGLDWPWLEHAANGQDAPTLRRLVERSARALYNPLATPREAPSAYLSAALGVRIESPVVPLLGSGPEARSVYRRRTGQEPPRTEALVLNLPRLQGAVRAAGGFAPPGWLGEALEATGVRAAVLGDRAWVARPLPEWAPGWARHASPLGSAALLVMDGSGGVAHGEDIAVDDPAAPGGIRTGWESVPARLEKLAGSCRGCAGALAPRMLVVVASGDLWRLQLEQPELSPAAYRTHERRLATALERLVAWWETDAYWGRGSLLLVGLAPGPWAREQGRVLTALVWAGPWGPSALYSPGTRRPGLVTAPDLAPTLASLAGAGIPAGVVGRPLAPGRPAPRVEALSEMTRERATLWRFRLPVMGWLTTAQVLVLAACLAGAAAFRARWLAPVLARAGGRLLDLFALAATWAVAVPVALLVPWASLPPLAGGAGPGTLALLAASSALGVAVGSRAVGRRAGLSATAVVAALASFALFADLLLHLDLVPRSFMGYDLIGGARFYGIGNEHMGLLLGSTLVAAAEGGERFPRAAAAFTGYLLAAGWLVGFPLGGANVGGAVACSVAFGIAAFGWHAARAPGRRAALARGAAGLTLAAASLAAFGLGDLMQDPGMRTHLGHTLEIASAAGPKYVLSVAARKAALNLRLLRYSLYSRILMVAMIAVMASFWAQGGALGRPLTGRWRRRIALEACAVGAAAALLANDSGVTAAAGALLAPAAWVLEDAIIHHRDERASPG